MNLRILVTGKNRRIANDICDHLKQDRDYEPMKCAASKKALIDTVLTEMPHIIIICLGNETPESVKIFNVLCDSTGGSFFKVFVVANDADRKVFINEGARRKPDRRMSAGQVQQIGMLLQELRNMMKEADGSEWLRLPEDIPGQEGTEAEASGENRKGERVYYGDMFFLICPYKGMADALKHNRLWKKETEETAGGQEK